MISLNFDKSLTNTDNQQIEIARISRSKEENGDFGDHRIRYTIPRSESAKREGSHVSPDHVFIFKIRAKQMKRIKGRIGRKRGAKKEEERKEARRRDGGKAE